MTDDINDLPKLALEWYRAGRGVAIATVVQTWALLRVLWAANW